jgi:hypothetical protein
VSSKAKKVAELVSSFVVPIFGVDKTREPEFHGSGVLIRQADRFLVVSAAHVFDRLLDGVHLLLPKRERQALSNPITLTVKDSNDRRTGDQIDLGYVDLTEAEIDAVGSTNFLQLPQATEGVQPNWATRYVILGYAEKDQSKMQDELIFRINQSYYTAPEVSPSTYERARLTTSEHIALEFNRSRIASPRGRGGVPKLHGMSGAGIWRFHAYTNQAPRCSPELVGFLAGPAAHYKKALFGARVAVLLSMLNSGESPQS